MIYGGFSTTGNWNGKKVPRTHLLCNTTMTRGFMYQPRIIFEVGIGINCTWVAQRHSAMGLVFERPHLKNADLFVFWYVKCKNKRFQSIPNRKTIFFIECWYYTQICEYIYYGDYIYDGIFDIIGYFDTDDRLFLRFFVLYTTSFSKN